MDFLDKIAPNRKIEFEIETNENDCMLVISHKPNKDGHINIGVNNKTQPLHRLVYEHFNGKIESSDLVVRHTCDNPNCININHLVIGTHQENVQDRVKRNRTAKGENNGRAKMSLSKAQYIRENSHLSNTHLAKMFGVDRKVIYNIKNNISWVSTS